MEAAGSGRAPTPTSSSIWLKPEFVSGLRFRFSLIDPGGVMPNMKVRWYSESKAKLQQYNCHYGSQTGEETEVIVYIDDMISNIMIFPNNRRFHVPDFGDRALVAVGRLKHL